jgi:hypothetical protein
MLKTISLSLLLVAASFASPTLAQSTKPAAADQQRCADQFKAADIDNNGVLSRTEIGNAKQTLPASVADKNQVTRAEFMTLCSKSAS